MPAEPSPPTVPAPRTVRFAEGVSVPVAGKATPGTALPAAAAPADAAVVDPTAGAVPTPVTWPETAVAGRSIAPQVEHTLVLPATSSPMTIAPVTRAPALLGPVAPEPTAPANPAVPAAAVWSEPVGAVVASTGAASPASHDPAPTDVHSAPTRVAQTVHADPVASDEPCRVVGPTARAVPTEIPPSGGDLGSVSTATVAEPSVVTSLPFAQTPTTGPTAAGSGAATTTIAARPGDQSPAPTRPEVTARVTQTAVATPLLPMSLPPVATELSVVAESLTPPATPAKTVRTATTVRSADRVDPSTALDRPVRGVRPVTDDAIGPVSLDGQPVEPSTRPSTPGENAPGMVAALLDATVPVTTSGGERVARDPQSVVDQLTEPVADAVVHARVPGASKTDVHVVLQPEGLGRVRIGATLVDGRVHVEISCDSNAGATTVRATLDGLRDRLDAVTGAVTQLVVVHRPTEPGATNVPSTLSATTWTPSGHRGGSHPSAPHTPTPGGARRSAAVVAERTGPDRAAARRSSDGDELDLLI